MAKKTAEYQSGQGFQCASADSLSEGQTSLEDIEAQLMKECAETKARYKEIIYQLVEIFSTTGRPDMVGAAFERLFHLSNTSEEEAFCLMQMGIMKEQVNDYEDAAVIYREALKRDPQDSLVCYFLNNNLGFSLNQLGQCQEAESYCRTAIKIDPERYNAIKNLGISLQGQGKHVDAARYYILAISKCPTDTRSFEHLEALIAEHKAVLVRAIPDIDVAFEKCRKEVHEAQKFILQKQEQIETKAGNC